MSISSRGPLSGNHTRRRTRAGCDDRPGPVQRLPPGHGLLPEVLARQLREGGRVVALFREGNLGVVRLGRKIEGHINWRFAFNAAAPVLPGFAAPRGFVL